MRYPISASCLFAIGFALVSPLRAEVKRSAVIEFASGAAAVKAITDDSADPYFAKLQALEIELKTGEPLPAQAGVKAGEIARERYGKLTLEFTPAEKEALQGLVAKVDEGCAALPVFRSVPWRFVKVSDKLEGGLPHTRGGYIVLAESTLKQMETAQEMVALRLEQMLAHEKVHVHQRLHPGFYDDLHTRVWKWKKVTGLKIPEAILRREIHNPDGVDANWALRAESDGKETLLLPILQVSAGADGLPMAQALSMEVITLQISPAGTYVPATDQAGAAVLRPLAEVHEFKKAFPSSGNTYHPNEASADIFSTILLLDHLLPKEVRGNPNLVKLAASLDKERAWFTSRYSAAPAK